MTGYADFEEFVVARRDALLRTAYLLTGNYRVILDYNCSNYYALSVGLLGFVQILWDRNRQGLHDKACETVVVMDSAQALSRS